VKGHRLACEEKIEGKLRKIKKLEASIIKRHQSINF